MTLCAMLWTGSIDALGGHIVEQEHGRTVAGEIMLQREDLPAIAQRALRQQADFRQAVDHDALRLQPLDRIEDALHGLAELEIGGIEQALMLVGVEHALRRQQFEDLDCRSSIVQPCERAPSRNSCLGLGEADVDADFARFGARQQKLQGDRRLARAGTALEQMQAVTREAAAEDIVEAGDADRSTRQ